VADLAGAHGEARQDHIAQVKGIKKSLQVCSVGAVVMTGAQLRRLEAMISTSAVPND
jgi:hypothetical protein